MHFGMICPPVPGHLYPHCMLALELMRRGHNVTVFNIPDAKVFVERLGVRYYTIGEDKYPLKSWHRDWAPALTGSNPLRDLKILNVHIDMADMMLRELPLILKAEKVDVLLVDQLEPQGATLAEYLSLSFITICSILPIHPDSTGNTPCALAWWTPDDKITSFFFNKLSHQVASMLARYYMRTVNPWRKRWGLKTLRSLGATFSPLAQIGIIPEVVDFPRQKPSPHYYAVGTFTGPREEIPFPWERLDGRPIVYASLGTIRNNIVDILDVILQTMDMKPAYQLVLSKGAWIGNAIALETINNAPIIIDYAPQLKILERASVCITHAGPGTVMECIRTATPMIAIPIADDQPAMAARVKFHGLGVVISRSRLTVRRLSRCLDQVFADQTIARNVKTMSEKVKVLGGEKTAASIIEDVLSAVPHQAKKNP